MKIITAWKKLAAICADRKVTKEELPDFLEALAELMAGVVELVLPFLKGPAAALAKNVAAGLSLAAKR